MNRVRSFVGALLVLAVASPVAAQSPPPAQAPAAPPSSASSPAASPGQGAASQPGLMIASDSLLGAKVRDPQGKEIGEISKLLIDPNQGTVASAIIKEGGKLGVGGREISVPWQALQLQQGQNQELVVTMRQPMLDQAPAPPSNRQR